MKNNIRILFIALSFIISASCFAGEPEYDHIFFDNSPMGGRYFYSQADYRTPSYIQHEQHRLPVSSEHYFTAKNSLKVSYVSAPQGSWDASVVLPPWRGKDFYKKSKYLDFRMLVTTDETIPNELPSIAIGIVDLKKDTSIVGVILEKKDTLYSGFIHIGKYVSNIQPKTWVYVHIPLSDFKNVQYESSNNIKKIAFKQASNDGKQHTLFIDQIELVPENTSALSDLSTPADLQAKAYERHVDLTWNKESTKGYKYIQIYRAEKDGNFRAVGIQDPQMGRYADFTGEAGKSYQYKISGLDTQYKESKNSSIVSATTYEMTDEQLLDMLQEVTFRYYWEGAEPNSGLALENIPGRKQMIATGASGFGIMSIIVAVERGFITREAAVERFVKIVDFLKKADRYHGAYAHFIDGLTGKTIPYFGPKDNGADLVETSFLFEGLLTARQYFNRDTKDEKHVRETINTLWREIEWDWYKQTKNSDYLYWHWSPDQAWTINHTLIGWNETMITYLLAIASPTHGVSKDMYYSGWASQKPEAMAYRKWGGTSDGEMYTNGNTYYGIKLDVGVSTGGPIFFTHFSFMGLNPHGLKDKYVEKDYFSTFRNMALINYRYCVENPKNQTGYGPDCWGLNASDGPWGYRASEPSLHQDEGTMSPAGALATFPYTPDNSMAAFKNYYRNYGHFLWSEYGFKDAFNLNQNWCTSFYMGLSQASIVVMIENYRSGLIWDTFMSSPEIRKMTDNLFTPATEKAVK